MSTSRGFRSGTAVAVLLVLLAAAACSGGASSTASRRRSSAPGAGRTGLEREEEGEGHRPGGSTLKQAADHDTSPPLRSIRPLIDRSGGGEGGAPTRDEILPHPAATTNTAAVQTADASRAAPTVGAGWDGLGSGFSGPAGTFTVNSAPPDTNSAVGPTQVVEIVNSSFAVFNKATGAATYGPAANNTLFSGFGGACQTTNDGDGVVRYDRLADRWVITQFANAAAATGPYYECVAVSKTSDATGAYNRYSFQYADFPDYPKLSVWPDAYYVTYNVFSGNTFKGAMACAMDRAKMLTGAAATQQCFSTTATYGGLLPADLDGATPPPSGAPNVVVGMGATSTSLAYWKFHVDWSTPANTTFTGPTSLAVSSYSPACGGATCIVQPGTTNKLDSLADRLMFRLAYRNFGDHEALVVTDSVTAGSSTGIRWYELRLSGGNPTVYQQGTYAPDANYRWMSSAAFDKAGNLAMGYSVSSSTVKPSLRASGRLAADPLNTMTQAEATLVAGGGSQTGTLTRWGDYASISIDPTDDCTFWFTSEYLGADGSFNWKTRNTSFQMPGCSGSVANDFSIAAAPASGSVTQGSAATTTVSSATTSGVAQSLSLAATGLPSGATASFSPASVTSGGSSTLTISTGAATPAGTYAVTVTATGATGAHSATYTLTVNPVSTGGGITNGNFEAGSLTGWTSTGSTSIVNTGAHAGTYLGRGGSTAATNGDSSISQTFTVPAGQTALSFWYKTTCPDTVSYDWSTATLKDNTSAVTTTPLAKTCVATGAWTKVTTAVVAGHSYTLTLTSHDDNYAGDATYTGWDDVALAAPPPPVAITNGGFETGSLSGWTSVGTTAVVTATPHGGTYAGRGGNTVATNGDSSVSQTFTPASGQTTLTFWYKTTCPDTVTYDWSTATLKNNGTGTTATVLAKTCIAAGAWTKVTVAVTAGTSYTLTLTSHDDNYASDPTSTLWDDIGLS